MGAVRKPEPGDWVVTLSYGAQARQVDEVKTRVVWLQNPGGAPRSRVNLDDVVACSPDKAAIDRLVERLKSAQAERDRRVREAGVAFVAKRRELLDAFNAGGGDHA